MSKKITNILKKWYNNDRSIINKRPIYGVSALPTYDMPPPPPPTPPFKENWDSIEIIDTTDHITKHKNDIQEMANIYKENTNNISKKIYELYNNFLENINEDKIEEYEILKEIGLINTPHYLNYKEMENQKNVAQTFIKNYDYYMGKYDNINFIPKSVLYLIEEKYELCSHDLKDYSSEIPSKNILELDLYNKMDPFDKYLLEKDDGSYNFEPYNISNSEFLEILKESGKNIKDKELLQEKGIICSKLGYNVGLRLYETKELHIMSDISNFHSSGENMNPVGLTIAYLDIGDNCLIISSWIENEEEKLSYQEYVAKEVGKNLEESNVLET